MKIHVLISLLLGILLASCSGGSMNEAAAPQNQMSDRSADTGNQNRAVLPDPSNVPLQAFEARAKQQLIDFYGCLNLISDPETDAAFKDQATEMALAFFESDSVRIHLEMLCPAKDSALAISDLLIQATSIGALNASISNVVVHGLDHNGQSYGGYISFRESVHCPNSAVSSVERTLNAQIQFFLVQEQKTFGRQSETVWAVRLGALEYE